MLIVCADIAPLPLRKTLGITGLMFQLAVDAVVYAHGDAAGKAACVELRNVLRAVAGVSPASYFGGVCEEGVSAHRPQAAGNL